MQQKSIKGTQRLKFVGEDAAARFLADKGFKILARNWRTRFGELDIVAMDGTRLVFVEVKARTKDGFMDPSAAVDYRKQVRLRRLAEAYLTFCEPAFSECRFDVVSVVAGTSPVRVSHLVDAF